MPAGWQKIHNNSTINRIVSTDTNEKEGTFIGTSKYENRENKLENILSKKTKHTHAGMRRF